MKEDLCYYEGCNRLAEVGGLCLKHYNLWLGNVDDKHKHGKSLEERFWSFVWKPTKDGCWLWRGCVNSDGYGVLRNKLAHRVSWGVHYGDIPGGLFVLHKCNICACVNPRHLYLGNNVDNMKDKVGAGTSDYGERNNHVKLTESDVLEIRYLKKTTCLTQKVMAKMFNVSHPQISYIVRYKNWIYPKILELERNG